MESSKPGEKSSQLMPGGHRRLVTIMFSDIKDYSKKMQEDEAAALEMLAVHNRMMEESIAEFEGNVVKTMGDAFLVTFESAVNATKCAIKAQQRFLDYGKEQPAKKRITVRIGVHIGDVVVKQNDVFGDGVNIASRIQSMAEPGGVSISKAVYDQVKNRIPLPVTRLGVPQLKNIKERVDIYQIVIVPEAKLRSALATRFYILTTILLRKRVKTALGLSFVLIVGLAVLWYSLTRLPMPNSLALLPFENLGDSSEEYIASGITEELINRVSVLPNLRVIGKKTTFQFRAREADETQIAEELGVIYVLVGNVNVVGDQITVAVHLSEPRKNKILWSEKYELRKQNLFELQNEIPRHIAARLHLMSLPGSEGVAPEVYDLYLRGLYQARKQRRENNLTAISYFRQAIEKNQNFARAYVELANSELSNIEWSWDNDERWLQSAQEHCLKALELDPNLGEALGTLGRIAEKRSAREEAVKLLERSLQLNPNNTASLAKLGEIYAFHLNEPHRAIDYFLRAKQIDPNDFTTVCNLAIGYGMIRDYHSAIAGFHGALKLEPGNSWVWTQLGICFERVVQFDSSIVAYSRALELDPANIDARESLAALLVTLKEFSKAESTLEAGLTINPSSYRFHYLIGVSKHLSGKTSEANHVWELGLKLAEYDVRKNPSQPQPHLCAGFFNARLRNDANAISFGMQAARLDSTSSEVLIGLARIYAILGRKHEMLDWYLRARSRAPDLDEAYLRTNVDFERFRGDNELRAVAMR